ncbi:MAG TPA: hypothetical protein VL334_04825 [Anaerolineae bacterium]|nr:hypothetical protein [Anaerolineae bacterium]
MTSNPSLVVWSRAAANDLARGLLTPLTWSILSRSAERAVRSHYSAWGVTLPAGAPIWRRMEGRAFLNTSALTAADQAVAASEAEATSGWRLFKRSAERRENAALRGQIEQAPARFAATQQWWERVQTMQWRQATVLQVMEEIEPQAEAVLTARDYLTTGLGAGRRQLTRWVAEWQPASSSAIFDDLFAGLDGREGWAQYRYDLQGLTEAARQDATIAELLTQLPNPSGIVSNYPITQSPNPSGTVPNHPVIQSPISLPEGAFQQAFDAFITTYARWADQPLETASPRWPEAPQALLARLAVRLAETPETSLSSPQAARQRRAAAGARIGGEIDARRRSQFEPVFGQLQQIVYLLPPSREALVTVMAVARRWALGAAQEAVNDGRLPAVEDVFLLELEELKQVMTGEWSSPEQVLPLVERRRAEQAAWAGQEPAEVVEGK